VPEPVRRSWHRPAKTDAFVVNIFPKKVTFLLNIPAELCIIQTAIEMADIAETRTYRPAPNYGSSLFGAGHAKNHYLARKAKF